MSTNLGSAYVQIIPSAEGISGSIAKLLTPEAKAAGTSAGGIFGGALTNKAKAVAIAGATALGAATVNIVKSSLSQYSDYEQLVGGAKLMFGDAYGYIAGQAAKAYSTVQLSQNDYLRQVNGFATGLKVSLGGNERAAAELANKIIQAEADIVAATGNTQENVQNAFNGIMKSNYTMLDNLQIGITPTKAGMQEVINKVNEYNAAQGNATNYTIGNLADCQSALVDYIAMIGMSGYAQAEAANTIQGTLAATQAAWSNLLVGIASGEANIDILMQNLMTSLGYLLKNVFPVIGNIIAGLPAMIGTFLATGIPALLSAGVSMIGAIIQGIITGIPLLLEGAVTMVQNLASAISAQGPTIIPKGAEMVANLVTGLIGKLPQIITSAGQAVSSFITSIASNLPMILRSGAQMLLSIVNGIISNLPQIVSAAVSIIGSLTSSIISNLPTIISAGIQMLVSLAAGVVKAIPQLIAKIPSIFSSFSGGMKSQNWGSIGTSIISGVAKGISSAAGKIASAAVSAAKSAFNAARKFLGINSPSKLFRRVIGLGISEGIAVGITENENLVDNALKDLSGRAVTRIDTSLGTSAGAKLSKSVTAQNDSTETLLGAAASIVDAINKKDGNTYLDGLKVSRSMSSYRMQQIRRHGGLGVALI